MIRFKRLPSLAVAGLLATTNVHAALDCTKDRDECARTLVAETAGYVSECGKAFPAAKELFDKAFQNWPVRKLKIPGLDAVLDPASPLRAQWSASAAERLTKLEPSQREAVCTARLASLTTPKPTLSGDSAQLPADALQAYGQ